MASSSNRYAHKSSTSSNGTLFLPMLCSKPSIKDVTIPRWPQNRRSASFSDEPLSPKVGCMGQVKKRNNRVIGYPSSSLNFKFLSNSIDSPNYLKLRKLFSAKNLASNINTNTTNSTSSSSCRGLRGNENHHHRKEVDRSKIDSIVDMDPPLPVIKKAPAESSESLWKRRSGGAALRGLQLQQQQQIHLPQPKTTV